MSIVRRQVMSESRSMKVYLMVFGGEGVDRETITRVLNETSEITDWRSDLPFCFYLHSTSEASTLSDTLKYRIGGTNRLFLTEITDNSDGFITRDSWYFLFAGRRSVE